MDSKLYTSELAGTQKSKKDTFYTLLIFLFIFILNIGLLCIHQFYLFDNGISKNDILASLVSPFIIQLVMLASPFLAARWFPAHADFDQTWVRRPRTKIRWYVLLITLPILIGMIIAVLSRFSGIPSKSLPTFQDTSKLTFGFFVMTALITALLGPISEEMFWRGYAQDQFCKCFGKKVALFLQAFLFALIHMRPILGFTSVFTLGLIFGFWRQKRRSLIPIIIAHIFVNGFSVLGTYPDQYELSKVKINKNYVEQLNKIGNIASTEQNAAPYYRKACEQFIDPPQEMVDVLRKNIGLNDLTTEQQKAVSLWISQNTNAIVQLKQGARKSFYWPNYSGTSMLEIGMSEVDRSEDTYKMSNICCALLWNATLSAQHGEVEKAIDEIVDSYRFGSHLMGGPKLTVSQLTGMSIRIKACKTGFLIMDSVEMSAEQTQYFQAQFVKLLEERATGLDLTCEKLTQYDNIQRVFTDDGNGNGHIPRLELRTAKDDPCGLLQVLAPGLTDGKIEKWSQTDRKQTMELIDELFEFLDSAFIKTPAQLKKERIDINKTIEEKTGNSILSTYIPDLSIIHRIFYNVRAFESAFLTTLAIFNYKNTYHTFPESLEILVAQGYMESLPIDPYSDKPLIYKKSGESFILYSVSGDFKDDGGRCGETWSSPDSDYVFWPPTENRNKNKLE